MSDRGKPISNPIPSSPSSPIKKNDGGGAPGPKHPNPVPCPPKPNK